MKTILFPIKKVLCIVAFAVCVSNVFAAQPTDSISTYHRKHIIQLNVLELMGHFYSALYIYDLSPKNKLMFGLAYENARYDFGTTHAPALILGYRRYFWKGFNAEYALWPAYNHFYEKNEDKYYNGGELWGEFRSGYDFEFDLGLKKMSFIITPQFILGKGLISGSKPKSFHDYYKKDESVFIAGNIAVSIKF
jgi:hypothetical protein